MYNGKIHDTTEQKSTNRDIAAFCVYMRKAGPGVPGFFHARQADPCLSGRQAPLVEITENDWTLTNQKNQAVSVPVWSFRRHRDKSIPYYVSTRNVVREQVMSVRSTDRRISQTLRRDSQMKQQVASADTRRFSQK